MDCRSSVVAQASHRSSNVSQTVDATPHDDLHLRDFSKNPSPRCYRGELTLVNPGTYHYRYRTRGKRRTTASLSLKRRNNRRCNPCEHGAWDGLEESEFEEYSRGNGVKKRSRPYCGQEFIEILGHEDIWRDVSKTMCALHIEADLIIVPTCVAIAAPDRKPWGIGEQRPASRLSKLNHFLIKRSIFPGIKLIIP